LLAATKLTGGDEILHICHHHWDDVQGLEIHVTSAIIPTFMICASICPKPACRLR
jgi:hypothetical protein